MKSKTVLQTVKAFNKVLETKRKPETLQADKGSEFLNKTIQAFLKEKGIHFLLLILK